MENGKLKVAIAADNYKVPSFRAKLNKAGYTIVGDFPFTEGVTILKVMVYPDKLHEIKTICEELEIKFHDRKSKNN